MVGLSLLGAEFFSCIGVHWESKQLFFSTGGDLQDSISSLFNTHCWGMKGCVAPAAPACGISWDYPTYPLDSTNKEHDISYMYDDLQDRILFVYKQVVIDILRGFIQEPVDENDFAYSFKEMSTYLSKLYRCPHYTELYIIIQRYTS